MKKGIAIFSIIISMFFLGVFVAPQKSEAGWDFSIGIGYSSGYDYGYNDYYPTYGYGNPYYGGYNSYGSYGGGYSYMNSAPIMPTYGGYSSYNYIPTSPYGYGGYTHVPCYSWYC